MASRSTAARAWRRGQRLDGALPCDHCWVDFRAAFPADAYRGTASYYDRYRPPYPEVLFDDLCERLELSGKGRLLDLACGTGQVAFPLAARFNEVLAVDQEEESVAFGKTKAEALGQRKIRWLTGAAETVELGPGFELVTIGTAFHRLDRPTVARRAFSWLKPGGALALLWSGTPSEGDAPWQRELTELMAKWMEHIGTAARVPESWQEALRRQPHEAVLTGAGFDYLGKFEFQREERWTAESLIGFMYSTSVLNRVALGSRAEEFESDISSLVRSWGREGQLVAEASYAYQLAKKPT